MDNPLTTRAFLLRALAEAPGYGSEIIQRVMELTGVVLFQGSVYPALVALEEDRMIRRKVMRTESRACYYELTKRGRDLVSEHEGVLSKLYRLVPSVNTSESAES